VFFNRIVIGHSMATVHDQTIRQEMNDKNNFRTSRVCYPSQNKKRSNATHKPTQVASHFILTNAQKTVTSTFIIITT